MTETLDAVLPRGIQEQAERVLDAPCSRELPIATAESCTGGLLAVLLTDVQGRSHIFERGFVVYSNKAKCDLLGLERAQVEDCGAVRSREVAITVAEGALGRSEAAVALSITGFAGPAPKEEDGEEGLVHFGCARRGGPTGHREERFGSIGRDGLRIAALRVSLEMIGDALDR